MVLESFWEQRGPQIKARTSVIILGDARNNDHASRAEVLRSIRQARHLYWLNPEPARTWDTGDSVLSEYGKYCDEVVECRSLRQLKEFVEALDLRRTAQHVRLRRDKAEVAVEDIPRSTSCAVDRWYRIRWPKTTHKRVDSLARNAVLRNAEGVDVVGVRTEAAGSAVVVVMDWPERRNALRPEDGEEVAAAIATAGEAARSAVILTGTGAFCAGGDLRTFAELSAALTPAEIAEQVYGRIQAMIRALRHCPVPTIAAVDGPAIGLGFDLALACDMRLVGPHGWFCSPQFRDLAARALGTAAPVA